MLGIFDSGIGGLTVVKELVKAMPNLSFVYFGDTARTPYGTKGPEVIKQYAIEDVRFLLDHGAKAIVVACNTVSSVAMEALRAQYPDTPFFEVVTPAVIAALEQTKTGRIGIMGTRATINSGIYEKLLTEVGSVGSCSRHRRDHHLLCHPEPSRGISGAIRQKCIQVFSSPAPLLVPLVEEGWLKKPETKRIIKQYVAPLKKAQVDALILGCTHFPLLKNLIAPIMGKRVRLIDPAEAVARQVARFAGEHPDVISLKNKPTRHYFVSDCTSRFQDIASKWLGENIVLER